MGVGKLIAIVEDGVPYGKVRKQPRPSRLPLTDQTPLCTLVHTRYTHPVHARLQPLTHAHPPAH